MYRLQWCDPSLVLATINNHRLAWIFLLSLIAGHTAEIIFGSTLLPLWITRVACMPVSTDPDLRSDEMYAWMFPQSSEARLVAERRVWSITSFIVARTSPLACVRSRL